MLHGKVYNSGFFYIARKKSFFKKIFFTFAGLLRFDLFHMNFEQVILEGFF